MTARAHACSQNGWSEEDFCGHRLPTGRCTTRTRNLDFNIAIENDTPPVRAYHLHAAPPSRGSADI